MKGFIVEHSNVVIDNVNFVRLFGRLENGESFAALKEFKPYFYIKKSELAKVSSILKEFGGVVEATNLNSFSKELVIKLIFDLQVNLNKCRHEIHKKNISTFEADLKSSFRFLIDNNIYNSINIEGECKHSTLVDRGYKNPKITSSDFKPTLKVLSVDIETGKKGELFCIGLYSDNYKKCFVSGGKQSKKDFVISCKDEKEVLEKFKKEFLDFDADIITGWNVIDFDFDFLRNLFEKYKIKFNLGRTKEKSRLKLESDFFRNSTLKMAGRLVLDGLNFIKDPYIRDSPLIKSKNFENYTLESVSNEMLGKGKLIKGKDRHEEIIGYFENNIDKLAEYNLVDCKLVYEILKSSKMINLAVERAGLTGMTLDRIGSSILSFDSLYIREATKKGFVSPTMRYKEKGEKIKGGFVMSPEKGIYDNVLVFDFKSLYPSIIRTFNIDPLSFRGVDKQKGVCTTNGACFENGEGVLPEILDKLHGAREVAKKEKRELLSYAIKIIMNSFFGVMASPNCRYFNMDIANAITMSGQELIKKTGDLIVEMGHKVIYQDTDSCFVKLSGMKIDPISEGRKIEKKINLFYKKYILERYNRKSFLELEFEKLYLSLLIPSARGSSSGAKKRYAGLKKVGNSEELEIVGLEAIRGDWTEAAGIFQKSLLDFVFHKKDFKKFIVKFITDLKGEKFNDSLIYRKQLRKNVDEYTKTTPPHVKAARKLKTLEGNLIEYIMTSDGPEPLQNLKHKLDYKHYIEKQIKPVANSILGLLNCDFDEILRGNKQMSLDGF